MQKKIYLLLFLSIILIGSGFLFVDPFTTELGICTRTYSIGGEIVGCLDNGEENFGVPAIFGGAAIAISLISLLIFPAAFQRWKKFAVWYIPLAAFIIFFAPGSGGSGGLPGWDKEVTTWFMAGVYVVASIAIVIVDFVKRKKSQVAPITKK